MKFPLYKNKIDRIAEVNNFSNDLRLFGTIDGDLFLDEGLSDAQKSYINEKLSEDCNREFTTEELEVVEGCKWQDWGVKNERN